MGIFGLHEAKWRVYRGEVREWTHANWDRWKEEKPAWFTETEEVIQRVPDEFVPVADLAALNAAHGGKRRRSSAGLASSVRESVRESVRRGSLRE